MIAIDKNKIFKNLDYIESMNQHGASPNLDVYWEEIVEMLSENIEATRKFLNDDCSEQQIFYIGGCFEEVFYKLQNYEFISIIQQLQKKYPNIDMSEYIKWTKYAIED